MCGTTHIVAVRRQMVNFHPEVLLIHFNFHLFIFKPINLLLHVEPISAQKKELKMNMAFLMVYYCCILRGPGGERTVDFVPGGTELEPQVKTGSWAGRTHSQ